MYASFSYSYFLQKFYLSTFWNSFLTFHFSSTFNSQNYSIYYNSFQRILLFGLNFKFGYSLLSFSSFPASEERETKGFLFLPPRLEVPVTANPASYMNRVYTGMLLFDQQHPILCALPVFCFSKLKAMTTHAWLIHKMMKTCSWNRAEEKQTLTSNRFVKMATWIVLVFLGDCI